MKNINIVLAILITIASQTASAQLWQIETRVEPKYPIKAIKQGLQGCVQLQYFIGRDGVPTYVELLYSSTEKVFDESAMDVLLKWQYKPTVSNTQRLTERRTVQLDFMISPNAIVASQCIASMTVESSNMVSFREARLSQPIIANNLFSWQSSVNKIFTVLSENEQKQFLRSYTSLANAQAGIAKEQALLSIVNGLTYQQVINLAALDSMGNSLLTNSTPTSKDKEVANKITIMPIADFVKVWEISDLIVGMHSSLYEEVAYQQLKIELLIYNDGSAKLLSICRSVSDEMKMALKESIADWQITSKIKSPKTTRFIYEVPAPREPGAFYQCDDNWHPYL